MIDDFLRPPGNRQKSRIPRPIASARSGNQGRPVTFYAQIPQPTPRPTPQPHTLTGAEGSRAFVGRNNAKLTLRERLQSISKKQWAAIGAAIVVLLGGGTAAAFSLLHKDPPPKKPAVSQTPTEPPKPTTVASTLTGLQVDPSVNERHVTAVMIENSLDARPQSGLNQAGVVFEAVAEGGITRFLALFQDEEPEYVGPVRSVRPYYIQWLKGFDAAVAHVGGSGEALAMLRRGEAKDLDQFAHPSAFWRVSNRYAPHNMYTSIPKLNEIETQKGYIKSNYTGFARKPKETPAATPTARSIDFNISGQLYNSHYDYDPATNTYKRSEGGKPHTDERTGAQLAPKVVIGLVMPQGRNGIYTTYQTIGSGQAFIFQDGTVTVGTWHKDSDASNFVFKDANGAILPLNPGQTWITVIGSSNRVTYAP